MAARRRDLQRALGAFLALDLAQVGGPRRRLHLAGLRGRQGGGALEMVEDRQQVRRGDYLHLAGPGGFGALRHRADEAQFPLPGMKRSEQHAGRRGDAAVQAQFAHHDIARKRFGIDHAHGAQQRQRDRQVEMRPLLGQIGGGKVHGDPLGRQRQADGRDGVAHPLPTFRHRLVRQADDDEIGEAGHELALNLHAARFQPQIGDRRYRRNQ